MRWILIVLLICISNIGSSQVRYASVYDSTLVDIIVPLPGDTVLSVRDKSQPAEWILYYDTLSRRKAAHFIRTKNLWLDSSWHSNGQLRSIWVGKPERCFECMDINEWFPDGSIKETRKCSEDSCISNFYYQSGKLKEVAISYRDSSRREAMVWHYSAEYYENGQLIYDITDPSIQKQTRRKYFPSGRVMFEVSLNANCTVGPYKEWHENGNVKVQGQFTLSPCNSSGIKIGTWSYYNESGKLIKEEFYEAGVLVKTIEY